jgi:Domain of unknown function (DUF397)
MPPPVQDSLKFRSCPPTQWRGTTAGLLGCVTGGTPSTRPSTTDRSLSRAPRFVKEDNVGNIGRLSGTWRKSSRSGATGCIEVAVVEGFVLLRDSKDSDGPILRVTPHQWISFLSSVAGHSTPTS